MRQFLWRYPKFDLITCARDLPAARRVFRKHLTDCRAEDPDRFDAMLFFVETTHPFETSTEYPIVVEHL